VTAACKKKNVLNIEKQGNKRTKKRHFAQNAQKGFREYSEKIKMRGFSLAKGRRNVYYIIQQGTGIVSRTPKTHKEEIKK
jgi:hypothetical protein